MSHITTERANELFWLGRYVERVYTTISEFSKAYDRMIDEPAVTYPEYCRRVSIPNVYADKEDFLRRYPFDDTNPDSIISNLIRAHDNAIVLRDDIGSETLSYIQLAIYDMRKAALGNAPLIGLQNVVDDLFAFWGCLDDTVPDYSERSIPKAARRVERIDLYLRFGMPADRISVELRRLENRIVRTGLKYDEDAIPALRGMLARDPVPYADAIRVIESMVDVRCPDRFNYGQGSGATGDVTLRRTELDYRYALSMGFDGEVSRHAFTLRCTPSDTLRQRVLSCSVTVDPEVPLSSNTDGYGNATVEGLVPFAHDRFEAVSEGRVSLPSEEPDRPVPECDAGRDDAAIYRLQTRRTEPGPAVQRLLSSLQDCDCDDLSRAVGVMHGLHSRFGYERGVTTSSTTAEQAAAGGRGVCQDYAQIMLSLLRCRGIPCRYVVGFTVGEGESHAWVEVLSGGVWYGLDPTGDVPVGPRHIKVSHGRDYEDCRMNRGVFYGGTESSQTVRVSVAPAVPEGSG